jgi:hypothetical protein
MMSPKLTSALYALLFAAAAPAPLSAQAFESGTARDGAGGTAYECLHVALLDSSGRAIDHTVTDSAGQFVFQVPRPGVYRVKFVVNRWEPLFGPVDTLEEGAFRERSYTLDFKTALVPDSGVTSSARPWGATPYALPVGYVREEQSDSGWTSHAAIPQLHGFWWPDGDLFSSGVEGSVVGQVIVDSTGRARRASWHPLGATRREFETAVVKALPRIRWRPALNRGQPVCEMALEFVRFSHEGGSRRIIYTD